MAAAESERNDLARRLHEAADTPTEGPLRLREAGSDTTALDVSDRMNHDDGQVAQALPEGGHGPIPMPLPLRVIRNG